VLQIIDDVTNKHTLSSSSQEPIVQQINRHYLLLQDRNELFFTSLHLCLDSTLLIPQFSSSPMTLSLSLTIGISINDPTPWTPQGDAQVASRQDRRCQARDHRHQGWAHRLQHAPR
jgi:hypothetical protein